MDSLDTAGTTTTTPPRSLKIRGSPGAVARRRRAEIRRFRVVATKTNLVFPEPVHKRPRSSSPNGRSSLPSKRSSPAAATTNFTITVSCHQGMDKHELSNGWQGNGGDAGGGEHSFSGSISAPSFSFGSDSSNSSGTGVSTVTTAGAGGRTSNSTPENSEEETVDGSSKDLPAAMQLLDGMAVSGTACNRSTRCIASDTCPPHGAVFICGRRREMEDAVAVVPSFMTVPCGTVGGCECKGATLPSADVGMSALHFFGVYDGHGGPQVAGFCKEQMHRVLEEEFSGVLPGMGDRELEAHLQRAMVASFLKVDAQVGGFLEGNLSPSASPFIAPETVGSTAVVAVLGPNRIIVANCGDSRAVLSRGGRAIPLSVDHKPDREDELARVEAAGGRVFFWNGYRVLGVLAMSRAIGDRYLKPFIIPEPDVTCTERSSEDECLILASDGLWDVLTNEMACDIARKCLVRHRARQGGESAADMAAGLLTKVAIAKGSTDNISVVVVDLSSSMRR
ncbi:probable protein phosphatase 2C 51 [Selaginella moellendorffii]|nr:probable protein phosphatase 2C 51 [Selaginella moellendorffii]|eukprot:XP_002980987.2 probable protein phosphatase 2C 51 [Selaginella moellendorffii]